VAGFEGAAYERALGKLRRFAEREWASPAWFLEPEAVGERVWQAHRPPPRSHRLGPLQGTLAQVIGRRRLQCCKRLRTWAGQAGARHAQRAAADAATSQARPRGCGAGAAVTVKLSPRLHGDVPAKSGPS